MKIEFSTDNAAFEDDLPGEVQIILENIMYQVDGGRSAGIIHDTNGNRVGEWSL